MAEEILRASSKDTLSLLSGSSKDTLSPPELPPPEAVRKSLQTARTASPPDQTSPLPAGLSVATSPVEEIAAVYNSSVDLGLSSTVAADRLQADGPNELEKPPNPGIVTLFFMQLLNFVIELLLVAAVGSILVNATSPTKREDPLSYITGIAIFILVVINAGISAKTEAQANGALDALSKMSQAKVLCLREGRESMVPTNSLVRGDIVILNVGDVIPADIRMIEAADLKVNEMPLTGEPEDVSKTHKVREKKAGEAEKLVPDTMVFASCTVTNGRARGLVVETGMSTRIGTVAKMLQEGGADTKCFCLPDTSARQTPLQKNVEKLGANIGGLAIVVCIGVFIVGCALQRLPADYDPESNKTVQSVIYMVLIAVTLAVAAIPEGIPLCVTISLSIGCSKMVQENVLVRKLAAVETLGSASVICTDKTGTLTEGKMTMVQMWAGGRQFDVSGKGFDPTVGTIMEKEGSRSGADDPAVMSTLFAALMCCTTVLRKNSEGGWEYLGNSSEAPIVVAARKVGLDGEDVTEKNPRVLEVPFSSARKMMLTVSSLQSDSTLGEGGLGLPEGSRLMAVCKGAPNFIIDACASVLDENGSFTALTPARRAELLEIVDRYSAQALRVLAIGIRPWAELPFDAQDEELSTDAKFAKCQEGLQLLGLVASIDPERNGVPEAVLTARGAGIRVIMITGDYLKTAVAIAHNCNILAASDDDERDAIDCGDLRPGGRYLTDGEMESITSRVKVFARAQPADKLEIVKALQRQGLVSAMTGDGVNDAPALNRADIGVAMNLQGTEVAKSAADMWLMDDNFANIVKAVEKGRVIYSGIQKFVAFIMSVHIAEVIQIFFCIVAGLRPMRSPLQILFLILVTDLPPSIALGMEPAEPGILKLRPRPKKEPIVLAWMWQSITVNGFILAAVIILVYVASLEHYLGAVFVQDMEDMEAGFRNQGEMKARTVAFISLVFSENARAFISRSFNKPVWNNLFGNVHMFYAVILAQVMLMLAVFLPVLSSDVLQLDGMEIGAWGWAMALVGPLACTAMCEAYKLVTNFQMQAYQRRISDAREREEPQGNWTGLPNLEKRCVTLLGQPTPAGIKAETPEPPGAEVEEGRGEIPSVVIGKRCSL